MSLSSLTQINYLAVCLAAIASYVLGGLWYAVLFAKAWSKAYGFEEGEAIKLWKSPGATLSALLLGDLAGAFVIALLIVSLGVESAVQGVLIGFLLWLGAAGAYGLGAQMAAGRSLRGYVIDTGRQLASFVLMGGILGVWH
jgi:hypothetical protein